MIGSIAMAWPSFAAGACAAAMAGCGPTATRLKVDAGRALRCFEETRLHATALAKLRSLYETGHRLGRDQLDTRPPNPDCSAQPRQNWRENSTNTENISSRPSSMAVVHTQV
jgi:hypothetical protein